MIALVGAIEAVGGLTDLPQLFGDTSRIAGVTLASLAVHPLLGLAALGFALTRRLRHGIVALALFAAIEWASEMPSVIREGFELNGDTFLNCAFIFRFAIQPVIALAAIIAAWLDRHLTAAAIGVMLPTLIDAAIMAAFAIAVALHGF